MAPKHPICKSCCRVFSSTAGGSKNRCPVLLKCGHNICDECSRTLSIDTGSVQCIQCQETTEVTREGLTPDRYLVGCMMSHRPPTISDSSITFGSSKSRNRNKPDVKPAHVVLDKDKCEECCSLAATVVCDKCDGSQLCQSCFTKVHSSSKLLSRHLPRQLPPPPAAAGGPADAEPAAVEAVCREHDNRPLEYFCLVEQESICGHCFFTGTHKGHSVETMTERLDRRLDDLKAKVLEGQTTSERTRKAIKYIERMSHGSVLNTDEMVNTVQLHFSRLHGLLQLRQQQLLQDIAVAAAFQKDSVLETLHVLESQSERLSALLVEAQGGLTQPPVGTFNVDVVLRQLDDVLSQPSYLQLTESEQRKCQVRFTADADLVQQLDTHGHVQVEQDPVLQLLTQDQLPDSYSCPESPPDTIDDDRASLVSSGGRQSAASGHRSLDAYSLASCHQQPTAGELLQLAIGKSAGDRASSAQQHRGSGDRRMAANLGFLSVEPTFDVMRGGGRGPKSQRGKRGGGATLAQLNSAAVSSSQSTPDMYVMEQVCVTHMTNPSSFFVRRHCHQRLVNDLRNRINVWRRNAAKTAGNVPLMKNQLCLAQYSGDRQWFRAKITDVFTPSETGQPIELDVFYVDFGNHERVTQQSLCVIPPSLARDPFMAVRCGLWDVVPPNSLRSWPEHSTRALADLVRNDVVLMTTMEKKGDVHLVDLLKQSNRNIRLDKQQSLREHLVFVGLASFINPEHVHMSTTEDGGAVTDAPRTPIDGPYMLSTVHAAVGTGSTSVQSLPPYSGGGSAFAAGGGQDHRTYYPASVLRRSSQTDVVISHADSPDRLYVQQLGAHARYLEDMMTDMQKVYQSSTGAGRFDLLSPHIGQVCVARFSSDGKFYRAVIEKLLPQAMVEVFYVDYGNRERLSMKSVKKIEDQFLKISRQAVQCTLADILPTDRKKGWSNAAASLLMEYTDKRLRMYVDHVSADAHTVTLYQCGQTADVCINALLVRHKLAQGIGPSTRMVEFSKMDYEPVRGPKAAVSGYTTSGIPPMPPMPYMPFAASSCASTATGLTATGLDAVVAASAAASPVRSALTPFPPATSAGMSRLPTGPPVIVPATSAAALSNGGGADGSTERAAVNGAASRQGPVSGPNTGTAVVVSHFESPARFWVQLADEVQDYNRMMREMQSSYGGSPGRTVGFPWKVGDSAVALCTSFQRHYRVRIEQLLEDERFQVSLLDTGETAVVQQQDVFVLMSEFEKHRGFALLCHLSDVRPAGDQNGRWTGYARDFMQDMINKSRKLFLMPKGMCAGPQQTSESPGSLACDLEAEEELSVGALEPVQVIRTSLVTKLIREGLAFANSKGDSGGAAAGDGDAALVSLESMSVLSSLRSRVSGTGSSCGEATDGDVSPTAGSVSHGPVAQESPRRRQLPKPLPLPEEDASSPPMSPTTEDDEIPMGADWTVMQRQSAVAPPTEAAALDVQLLDDELAAEQLPDAPPDCELDWLPARLPDAREFVGVPTNVNMAGMIFLHAQETGKEALQAMKQAMKSKFQGSEPRPCDAYWSEGQPCIAKYFLDRSWYRARVIKKHGDNKASVVFVDYGNTDKVDVADLRKNIFLEDIPIQAIPCELYNVVPLTENGQFDVKTLDFIHTQVVEKECRVVVHHVNTDKRRLLVTLRLLKSDIDINQLLVQMGDARPMSDEELQQCVSPQCAAGTTSSLVELLVHQTPYTRLGLPPGGQLVPVLCAAVLAPNLVLLQPQLPEESQLQRLAQRVRQLAALPDQLQLLSEQQPALATVDRPPERGMACLARYSEDKLWYRALVVQVLADGDTCEVIFVDWGNMEQTKCDGLRALPESLSTLPAWTVLVRLHKLTPPEAADNWPDQARDAIKLCLFSDKRQLWANLKMHALPPVVEILIEEDSGATALVYQSVLDDGFVALKGATANRR